MEIEHRKCKRSEHPGPDLKKGTVQKVYPPFVCIEQGGFTILMKVSHSKTSYLTPRQLNQLAKCIVKKFPDALEDFKRHSNLS